MEPFRAADRTYDRSIAIDASTIGDITVTVAVATDREEEFEVLDTIYRAAEGYDFFPFRDKAHDLEYAESRGFFEAVIQEHTDKLVATTHLGRDNSGTERVEAVQSAVLTRELPVKESLIILDGAEDKAERFGRAFSGIALSPPSVATCIQSEYYYPAALLADMCASHLAHQINHPRHCSEVTPKSPVTKQAYSDQWGAAYNALVNRSTNVMIAPVKQRRADTVSSRVHCWFRGWMGGGEPDEFNRSVRPVVEYARRQGYDELAERLAEI
ncbi:hypothetical protein [Halarchaeum salinum]|uniref:DUF3800 domain-containing protein n=1 Tax=Halarchaeum salinum TaxID=489912 RepID=A0AAV3S4N6_9EURY